MDPEPTRDTESDQQEEQESVAEVAANLAKLEENVRVHRMLLEAEERLLYMDVIAELEHTRDQITRLREQQQQRYTPWVRARRSNLTHRHCQTECLCI